MEASRLRGEATDSGVVPNQAEKERNSELATREIMRVFEDEKLQLIVDEEEQEMMEIDF